MLRNRPSLEKGLAVFFFGAKCWGSRLLSKHVRTPPSRQVLRWTLQRPTPKQPSSAVGLQIETHPDGSQRCHWVLRWTWPGAPPGPSAAVSRLRIEAHPNGSQGCPGPSVNASLLRQTPRRYRFKCQGSVSRRIRRKVSWLPFGPLMGLSARETSTKPRATPASETSSTACLRTAGSRTTPPEPTFSRPT